MIGEVKVIASRLLKKILNDLIYVNYYHEIIGLMFTREINQIGTTKENLAKPAPMMSG